MYKLAMIILISFPFLSQMAIADIWAEREALAKIKSELVALEILVKDAKNRSNSEGRTMFDYRVLLSDLRKIQKGISHHLTAPMEPVHPSLIDALSSDYTEHQK